MRDRNATPILDAVRSQRGEAPPPDPFALVRVKAQACADEYGVTMVIGWQTNDVTGEREPGYCPSHAAGPAFVHTVTETIRPNT